MVDKEIFNGMKYNPFAIRGYMVQQYKELAKIKSFMDYREGDRDQVIRYIVLMYHETSPLPNEVKDLELRKHEAAALAGFPKNMRGFSERVDMIFDFSDQQVLGMICEFMQLQRNRLWQMINSTEQAFNEYQKLIMSKISDKREVQDVRRKPGPKAKPKEVMLSDKDMLQAATLKSKLMNDCDEMHERLNKYYKELYGDDEELVKKAVKHKKVSPEMMARGD